MTRTGRRGAEPAGRGGAAIRPACLPAWPPRPSRGGPPWASPAVTGSSARSRRSSSCSRRHAARRRARSSVASTTSPRACCAGGARAGRPSAQQGVRYPADPPSVEEIVAVMRAVGDSVHGRRLRGLIVLLWRAGLRISEALALGEPDLDPRRGLVLVRRGKGGRRREVGMDDSAWRSSSTGLRTDLSCPSARCCASSLDRPTAVDGPAPPLAPTSATPPQPRECVRGSRRISCVTRTPSR